MPVEYVLEVAELGQVRPVPGARPELLGVRNLRGRSCRWSTSRGCWGSRGRRRRPACWSRRPGAGRRFAIDEVSGVGELADPAEESESGLLAGATIGEGDLIGVIDVPRVLDSLEQAPR